MSIPASEESLSCTIGSSRPEDPHHFTTVGDIPSPVLAEQRATAGRAVVAYSSTTSQKKRPRIIVSLLLLFVLVGGLGVWLFYIDQPQARVSSTEIESPPAAKFVALASTPKIAADGQVKQVRFLEVPVDSNCLVMIQATKGSPLWPAQFYDSVREVVGQVPGVAFFVWSGKGVLPWQPGQKIIATGQLQPADALGRVVAHQPKQVILVGGGSLASDQIQAIDHVLDPQTRLDVVWVDADLSHLAKLVKARGGIYRYQDSAHFEDLRRFVY